MNMKKIILIFVFSFVGLHCKAQQEYDTMIYHPQEMSGCIMDFDENFISGTGSFGNYFFRKMLFCDNTPFDTPLFLNINTGVVISSNAYNPEAFAQPYHFDSIVSVCGIAARVYGNNDGGSYFHLIDSSLTNDLASTIVYHSIPQDIVQQLINTGTPGNRFMTVLHNYYFQNPISI